MKSARCGSGRSRFGDEWWENLKNFSNSSLLNYLLKLFNDIESNKFTNIDALMALQ